MKNTLADVYDKPPTIDIIGLIDGAHGVPGYLWEAWVEAADTILDPDTSRTEYREARDVLLEIRRRRYDLWALHPSRLYLR